MNAPGSRKKLLTMRLTKGVGITLLAFGLSLILMQPFSSSTSAMFATPERNDFTIPDFYNLVADSRAVSRLDDNIVIVNIDNSDRAEIADILTVASLSGAAAIGLDAMFDDPRDGDEVLLDAIKHCHALVQPLGMKCLDNRPDSFAVRSASYFYAAHTDSTSTFAGADLPSKYEKGMIREMQTVFHTAEAGDIQSFAVALAGKVSPEAVDRLNKRGKSLEMITYHSRRFRIIEPADLLDRSDELTGRVVLVGAMNERGDLHPTPVRSSMPGVMIHAHALATILDGAYMTSLPKAANMLIGCVLCFIIVITHVSLSSGIKGLLIRIMQLSFLWIAVQIGYWCFVSHNLVIDFSYSLLMLAFGVFACDIWNGLAAIGSWIASRLRIPYKLITRTNNN